MLFRPYRSPILPQRGVETVVPRTYAVTTQDRWDSPCRSPTIRGMAVLTIMLSSMASIIASISAGRTARTSRRVATGWVSDTVRSPGIRLDVAYLPTG